MHVGKEEMLAPTMELVRKTSQARKGGKDQRYQQIQTRLKEKENGVDEI